MRKVKNISESTAFPCLEPPRCYLLFEDGDGRTLMLTPSGKKQTDSVTLTPWTWENGENSGEWHIIVNEETDESGQNVSTSFSFLSVKHSTYLSSDKNGRLSTSTEKNDRWEKWVVKGVKGKEGMLHIMSQAHSHRCLSIVGMGGSTLVEAAYGPSLSLSSWRIELATGELCFLTNVACDQRLMGHAMATSTFGSMFISKPPLTLSKEWGGWEIWRFICVAPQEYILSSWTHGYVLCSDDTGKVFVSTDRTLKNAIWKVSKTNKKGLIIQSKQHERLLVANNNDSEMFTISTVENGKNNDSDKLLWKLDTAHLNTFYLSSQTHENKLITADKDGSKVSATSSGKGDALKQQQWQFELHKEGYYTISSTIPDQEKKGENDQIVVYLASTENGQVYLSKFESSSHNCQWEMETKDGHTFLSSRSHERTLSCNPQGELCTTDSNFGDWEKFAMTPYLPTSLTKRDIFMRSAGVATVALAAVASPFAVVAGVNAIGFGSTGIVAGSQAAAMMSAEAVASGGAVMAGGTVATLQSIGAVGLGAWGTTAAVSGGALLSGGIVGGVAAVAEHNKRHVDANAATTRGGAAEQEEDDNGNTNQPVRHLCNWHQWPIQNSTNDNYEDSSTITSRSSML